MMGSPSAFVGRWNIESMDLWDTDAINLVGQGHITFDDGGGTMAFICVNLGLDCRGTGTKGTSLAFTFIGDDEGDEVNGSGSARITAPGRITGKVRFHRGDESGFVARRAGGT
jgi:hypothetical protein